VALLLFGYLIFICISLLTKNHNEKAGIIDAMIVGIVFGGICFVVGFVDGSCVCGWHFYYFIYLN
jgi:hypothetical protein